MDAIKNYFGRLVFKKVEPYNENLTIYAARLSSYLGSQERYILLYVPTDISISSFGSIASLGWRQLSLAFTPRPPNKRYVIQKQRVVPMTSTYDVMMYYSDGVYVDSNGTVRIKTEYRGDRILLSEIVESYPYVITVNK